MRSRPSLVLGISLAALGTALALACGPKTTNVACTAAECTCEGSVCGGVASLDCGEETMCAPTCSNFGNSCTATCADNCNFQCMSGPLCAATCGDHCTVACSGTTTCKVTTGADSTYTCTNVNDCAPTVGDSSSVTCNSSGNCAATCTGACRVHCISTQLCDVTCPDGATPTMCSDGYACGQGC